MLITLWVMAGNQSVAWQNPPYPYYQTFPQGIQQAAYPTYAYTRYYAPNYRLPAYQGYAQAQKYPKSEASNAASSKLLKPENEDIQAKKQQFANQLLPYIRKENRRLLNIRQQVLKLVSNISEGRTLSQKRARWLKQLATKYNIKNDPIVDAQARKELLKRVDIIPASLTLAQAANESAWGKSRFALKANNLFGIWTYDENKGLKPRSRDDEKKHLVRKFEDIAESIQYYMQMLNTHPAYAELRDVRAASRDLNLQPEGTAMARGLKKYSAKGQIYIELIQQLIRQNQWSELDPVKPVA